VRVGPPVHFTLTSATVMNAFFVPRLGSMIYTMNGMATQLHLQADRPGVYYGQSAMFSGDSFPDMHFPVRALLCWVGRKRARPRGPARPPRVCTPRQTEPARAPCPARCRGARGAIPRFRPSRRPAMLGKLDWSAVPLGEPIPLAAGAAVFLVIVAVLDRITRAGH
jgi:hypothetical protein